MSKRNKVVSGLLWSLLNNFGRQGVTFVISIILARVLVPEDFGLIGMLTFFIAVSQSLIEGGFSQTLIKEKDLTSRQLSTVFYINFGVGLLLYLILFVSAPFISDFYKEPRLTPILRVMAISIVIRSLNLIQNVVQVRNFNFKAQFKSRVPSVIVAGIAGVVMAYSGFGVWSIVYQQLLTHILILISLWIQTPWMPVLAFNLREVRDFFSLSSSLLFIRIVNNIFENIYYVIIGKFFSAIELAYYVRALSLKQLPLTNIGASLNSVTLPVFSKLQHDDAALRQLYLRSISYVSFIIYPVFAYLIVMAFPLITLLLTDKWQESIVFFQWLCIIGFFYPLTSYNTNILIVKGRGKEYIRLELAKKILTIAGIYLVIRFGVMGLVYFQVAFSCFEFLVNSYFCGRTIGLPAVDQLMSVFKPLAISLVMMLILEALRRTLDTAGANNFIQVASAGIAGGGFYLLMSYRFNRDVFDYFWSFREKIYKRTP